MKKLFYIGSDEEVIEIFLKSNIDISIVGSHDELESFGTSVNQIKPITLFLLEKEGECE